MSEYESLLVTFLVSLWSVNRVIFAVGMFSLLLSYSKSRTLVRTMQVQIWSLTSCLNSNRVALELISTLDLPLDKQQSMLAVKILQIAWLTLKYQPL